MACLRGHRCEQTCRAAWPPAAGKERPESAKACFFVILPAGRSKVGLVAKCPFLAMTFSQLRNDAFWHFALFLENHMWGHGLQSWGSLDLSLPDRLMRSHLPLPVGLWNPSCSRLCLVLVESRHTLSQMEPVQAPGQYAQPGSE